MTTKHVASVFIAASACALLAASCAQRPESEGPPLDGPRIETTDDGDPDVGGSVGSDPDVGGSVGGDPDVGDDPSATGSVGGDPAYWWSPPSGTRSDGDVGDSEPDPPTSSSGGNPMGGYVPMIPIPSPDSQPAESCAETCDRDFEGDSARCTEKATEAQRRECQGDVLAKHKSCQESCDHDKASDADCVEHCKEMCYDAMLKCKDNCRKKKKKDRNVCIGQCMNVYARCCHDCEKKCK
jgi:hypothetical protein